LLLPFVSCFCFYPWLLAFIFRFSLPSIFHFLCMSFTSHIYFSLLVFVFSFLHLSFVFFLVAFLSFIYVS
jgi:hypothetical protein